MKNAIQLLISTVKKIISELKPQSQALSMVILTGKTSQGKKTLLRQSHYKHVIAEGDTIIDIYYNHCGIILDLGETWLHHTNLLLQQTLKRLNRCHNGLKINGIILCVDVNELTVTDQAERSQRINAHTELLERFGNSLGYRIDLSVMLTKLDTLAGFCEFYQHEHASDLAKPLGFSLTDCSDKEKSEKNFSTQFIRFIESLNQQVLNKIHPARSSIKRTLIREFPLQVASLQIGIQSLILNFSPKLFRIHSIFFTSAEQGGFSLDQLNKKFATEYALTIQDKIPLANNFRAYFIQGALQAFQNHTKQPLNEQHSLRLKSAGIIAGVALTALTIVIYNHLKSNQLLDQASKEWIAFDAAAAQHQHDISAIYHLTSAASSLEKIHNKFLPNASVRKLKSQVANNKTQYLQDIFLPDLLKDIEIVLADNQQSYGARYDALTVYLMLIQPQHYQAETVTHWVNTHASKGMSPEYLEKKLSLIRLAEKMPINPRHINQQLLNDTRNILSALPSSYLYYSIAKNTFSTATQPLDIKGFSLAENALPAYFTKSGYHALIQQFPDMAKQLQNDAWVLDKQPPANLQIVLEEAYGYDYVLWWKNFIKKTAPLHAQSYQDAIRLAQTIRQSNAIESVITLIQQQTSPEVNDPSGKFNQLIANQFTDINLLNHTTLESMTHSIDKVEEFLTTLLIVNDQGKTAFTFTKSRFEGDNISNALSMMFNQAEQLPEPAASWHKQIASDTWSILINDTKHYINAQWQSTVYKQYSTSIAKKYPFDQLSDTEVTLDDFNRFFSYHGSLNTFAQEYIKPFLDTSEAQWKPKELNHYVLPISKDTIEEFIRANIVTNMFFPENSDNTQITFTLQKSDLDPAVSSLFLKIGNNKVRDTQQNLSITHFQWPTANAKLVINTLDGNKFTLTEQGVWAFFKLLQKVDVQSDAQDSSRLQVLFEISGNSGRYLLKTENEINPFTPGVLNGFTLSESIA
jgi:intracellular multiplication protein IcmF